MREILRPRADASLGRQRLERLAAVEVLPPAHDLPVAHGVDDREANLRLSVSPLFCVSAAASEASHK